MTAQTSPAPTLNEQPPIIQVNDNLLIKASDLHKNLKIKTRFNDWIERHIKNYSFEKGKDYYLNLSIRSDGKFGRKFTDYHLTLDTAKELCMVERSEIGRQFRRYFIEAERELRTKRLYAQTANLTQLSKMVEIQKLNGRKMYKLRDVRKALGYSLKSSTSNYKRTYNGQLVVWNQIAFISEEVVKVMMSNATTRALKEEAKAAQPLLPEGFGQLNLKF